MLYDFWIKCFLIQIKCFLIQIKCFLIQIKCFLIQDKMLFATKHFLQNRKIGGPPPTLSGSDWLNRRNMYRNIFLYLSVDFWTDFREVWGSCEILEKKHNFFRAPFCQTNASPSCGISETRCNAWCYNENPNANDVFIDENACKTFWSPKIFRT